MGGFGSGRKAVRPRLGRFHALRTSALRRLGGLVAGFQGWLPFTDGTRVWLETIGDAVLVDGARVALAWTVPPLGGRRAWFGCPVCGRRCAVLFGRSTEWGCRVCIGGSYASQSRGRFDRLLRRVRQLRARLDDRSVSNAIELISHAGLTPDKPRGMHWRSYARVATTLRTLEDEALELMVAEDRRLLDRLQGRGRRP
jgi:hypothetical protein